VSILELVKAVHQPLSFGSKELEIGGIMDNDYLFKSQREMMIQMQGMQKDMISEMSEVQGSPMAGMPKPKVYPQRPPIEEICFISRNVLIIILSPERDTIHIPLTVDFSFSIRGNRLILIIRGKELIYESLDNVKMNNDIKSLILEHYKDKGMF
jgi:hypothetical protein